MPAAVSPKAGHLQRAACLSTSEPLNLSKQKDAKLLGLQGKKRLLVSEEREETHLVLHTGRSGRACMHPGPTCTERLVNTQTYGRVSCSGLANTRSVRQRVSMRFCARPGEDAPWLLVACSYWLCSSFLQEVISVNKVQVHLALACEHACLLNLRVEGQRS